MSLRDILVGIDASTAGERLLRSALGLAREHKAYLAAAYCMAEDHAAVVLARAPVNPSPGIFVAPEVLTAPGDPAADPSAADRSAADPPVADPSAADPS